MSFFKRDLAEREAEIATNSSIEVLDWIDCNVG